MKLPLVWLKEYISIHLSAEDLEEKLTMSGSKVESVIQKGSESVIEIEVTTNRPDCLSILGLAREVAALTGKKVLLPEAYRKTASPAKKRGSKKDPQSLGNEKKGKSVDILIYDKKACPKYTGRIISGVRVGPSPRQAQKFLDWMDVRAISNVVDATNFVLFESGQPLHAFDFDKIEGAKVIVRRSTEGEKFLALDGIEHTLDGKTLVIADEKKVIALAGVMGGKLTEVTSQTRNIFLESAYFDPALVRQAVRKYRISTDSSYRFERGVDRAGVETASARAAGLVVSWAGGEASEPAVEDHSIKSKPPEIVLRLSRVEKILGMKVAQKRILSILASLSIDARPLGKEKVLVRPSTVRRDVTLEEDVIEEILRIEGFDKIPVLIPSTRYGAADPVSRKAMRIPEIKKYLAALGFSEIITYSLLSAKTLQKAGFAPESVHRVVNPVSAEQEFFRPSLLAGVLESAVFNIHRKALSLKMFEVGHCYRDGVEETRLGIFLYGFVENHWLRKSQACFHDLKGVAEGLFSFLGLKNLTLNDASRSWPGWGQSIEAQDPSGHVIARIGKVSSRTLREFDIPHDAFYAEMVLDEVLGKDRAAIYVKPVNRFPVVRRDMAFVVDEKICVAEIESLIRETASPALQEATLFDQYVGKSIAAGKRSLAFSLDYQKEDGTLTEDEIQGLQERVGQALKSRFHVEFR